MVTNTYIRNIYDDFFGEMLFLVLPKKYVGWLFISSILFLGFKNRKNLIDGFYNLEKENIGYFIWTSKKESKIEILNGLNKKVLLKLEFEFYGAPGIDKNIKVMFKNKVIGFGKTPKRIKTTIELNAKEKSEILILSEESLTQIKTDSRNFGIQLREIKLDIN